MTKQIKEIKVIKILDEFTLLINIGKSSGRIDIDDQIIVYEKGPQIEDIDGTPLGNFEFIKAKLLITDVQQEFSIAKHLKKNQLLSSKSILGGGYTSKGVLPLNDEASITPLTPENPEISVGDFVKIL